MRASTQPILLRRITAVTAAEAIPALANFISLTRSQWNLAAAAIPNLAFYQRATVRFGIPTLGGTVTACTIQLLGATPDTAVGPLSLGTSALTAGAFPEFSFDLTQLTLFPRVLSITGTTPAVTVDVWFQAFNPSD